MVNSRSRHRRVIYLYPSPPVLSPSRERGCHIARSPTHIHIDESRKVIIHYELILSRCFSFCERLTERRRSYKSTEDPTNTGRIYMFATSRIKFFNGKIFFCICNFINSYNDRMFVFRRWYFFIRISFREIYLYFFSQRKSQ